MKQLKSSTIRGAHGLLSRHALLLILVFCLTTTEFLQGTIVAINAVAIIGDLGASPEEFSLAATMYALVAVGAIYKQRWLVERLGWRLFTQISIAIFVAGLLVSSTGRSMAAFVVGRMLMAAGGATFVTVGRVIVNHIPASPRRFDGVRFFAYGLVAGSVLGPLIAVMALDHGSWRYAFWILGVPAVVMVALATAVLPDESAPVELRSEAHPTGLLLLMLGTFALLHALQRSSYDWFPDRSTILAWSLLAISLLVLYAFRERRRHRAPLQLARLGQGRYLLGVTAFTVAYMVMAGDNYVVPLLIRQGLGLPLQTVGLLLAAGAATGVVTWFFMARLMKRHTLSTPFYAVGFTCLTLYGVLLAHLTPQVHPWLHIAPVLMLHGMFVILVLATTAVQTYRNVQHDEAVFSTANQVKNMLGQFGTAAGIALATLVMQWRTAWHYDQFAQEIVRGRSGVDEMLAELTARFAATDAPLLAAQRALGYLQQQVAVQSTFMATTDYFWGISALGLLCLLLVVIEWGIRRPAKQAA
jgi:MFS family permease